MKHYSKLAIAIASAITCLNTAYATSIPNTDHPTTFVGPTLQLGYTSTLNDITAYSLAGEAGVKNFRVGGTIGFKLAENQLFKLSGEYLWQDITYAFFSGNNDQWVSQGAVGAAYQYEITDYYFRPQLGLSAYYSHAPSKTLSAVSGTFVDAQSVLQSYTDYRRIAGSNGAGAAPGITITPWAGGKIGAELNYDNVRYDTHGENEDAIGWGGTLSVGQALTDNVGLGLSAAVRKPFNNYAATLDWNHVQFYGDWQLGLFGDYTTGKDTLPNTWNVGLSANYLLDQRCPTMVPANLKGERNLKGEMVAQPISDDLLSWTADPAVYMPQVLAVVDKNVTVNPVCSPVTLLSTIPAITPDPETTTFISTAPFFSGQNLTFSITTNPASPDIAGNTVTINPTTGVITAVSSGDGPDDSMTVTVTASNACNSASGSFVINFFSSGFKHKK